MLKAYTQDNGHLELIFDTPMPPEAARHQEWKAVADCLDGAGAEIVRAQDGSVTGVKSGPQAWDIFMREFLTEGEYEAQRAFFDMLPATGAAEAGEGLQVNFHQQSFDTAERYWLFCLNQGHFAKYLFNRIGWYLGPKKGVVTPFPLHVDLETANTCNMNCPMCYRDMMDEVGQMDMGVFRKAVDECAANHVFSVRLSWRGEALTHPRIKEMIEYACERIPNVSFLTNAFYIEDDLIECLVRNQVAYIAVSFDGIDEIYEKIRHPATFDDAWSRLDRLRRAREAAGASRPQIRTCTIWPAVKDDPEAYRNAMSKVADYMVCNPYMNYKGPMEIKEGFICQYPWERIMVAWNGKTLCCTGWNPTDIVLGNVAEKSIKEMWHSPELANIRKIHAQGRRMELETCATCRHGCAGEPNTDIDTILERCH